MKVSIVTIAVYLALVPPAFAQTLDLAPLAPRPVNWSNLPRVIAGADPAVDEPEMDRWIQEYKAWQEWADTWLGRRQWVVHPFPYPFWKESPYLFSYVVPPRVEPQPPIWLEAACVRGTSAPDGQGAIAEGCSLLTASKDDFATQRIRRQLAAARTKKEAPPRSVFLEHVHFATLWTNLDVNSGPRAYGLAGVHATLDVHGRWQIYALPGILAVRVPNPLGEPIVTIGYDWGMAVRLFDLRVPIFDVPARAHLNLAQVWMPEVQQKISMAGLSFSLKKQR